MQAAQPSIDILGVTVQEPVTAATDLLVSAVCLFAYYKISSMERKESLFVYFRFFFLTMCIATAYGGIIGHAFLYAFGFAWKVPAWIISMASVALLERASIQHARPLMKPVIGKTFAIINIIELMIFVCISMYTLNFFFVEVHAAYGLIIVVLSFELFTYIHSKDKASLTFLLGVFFAFLSAVIHLNRISINEWFNYNDISHVFMAVSGWCFYKGVMRLGKTVPILAR